MTLRISPENSPIGILTQGVIDRNGNANPMVVPAYIALNPGGVLPTGPDGTVATAVAASSGNKAATAGTATLAAAAGKTTYITGFDITGAGATAASVISITITGMLGGTLTYTLAIPAGVTTAVQSLVVQFLYPMPASGANTAIVVNMPSFGAGNTNATANAYGFQL